VNTNTTLAGQMLEMAQGLRNQAEALEARAKALESDMPDRKLATTSIAAKIFGMSPATLYRLRVRYPDFRALTIKTGRTMLYDVPRCYEWFSMFLGGELDIEGEAGA
jgi:hypothetical protein